MSTTLFIIVMIVFILMEIFLWLFIIGTDGSGRRNYSEDDIKEYSEQGEVRDV